MSIQRARARLIITLVFIVVGAAESLLSLFSDVSGNVNEVMLRSFDYGHGGIHQIYSFLHRDRDSESPRIKPFNHLVIPPSPHLVWPSVN